MSRIRNIAFGCAMSAASVLAPIGAAQAGPLAVPGLRIETASEIVPARLVCNAYRCWNTYPRRYYRPRYYRPPVYRAPVYGGSAHVRWCLNRYRTYNPATNRYHAGGGVYPICYSPYR
ncbi:BA14K family protein [Rhizobium alarense]|uniref:BA14K family protein n=1 Tax=Rhizobium alarense TaxID=2846851 RepID=UPI0038B5993D